MIKFAKWTGFILFLSAFILYLLAFSTFLEFESYMYNVKGGDIPKETPFESPDLFFKWADTSFNGIGNLLLMSTLLFIGGLIAEQLASKKDE
ncbi:MAG: hypothetical protein O2827_05170 [Verrucomicrobia bacterium]|nr:hypothetical protein [Verrucomicrobiota bacterium]